MTLGERFRGGWVFLEHKKSIHMNEPQGFFFPIFFFKWCLLTGVCFFYLGGGSSGPFFSPKGMFFVK